MTEGQVQVTEVGNITREDTNEGSDPLERKALMIETYTEAIGNEKNDNTQKCINEALRGTIIPKKNSWRKEKVLADLIVQISEIPEAG